MTRFLAVFLGFLALSGITAADAAMHAGPGVVARNHRLGGGGGVLIGNGVQAGLDFRFTTGGYYQQGQAAADTSLMTVARASSKSCDNQAGNWTTVASNVLCATNKGALIEEARTNSIRNNSMTGAVPGTPGTLPTNWTVFSANGVVTGVGGVATVGGVDTVDVTFTGTTTNTFYVLCFEGAGAIAAAPAQVWAESFSVARVGAATGNIASFAVDIRQIGGAGGLFDTPFTPTSTLTRYSVTGSMGASATNVAPCLALSFASGATLNDTLRIGWPQVELGSFATSPIRTTNAAATRAADVVTVTTPPSFGSAMSLFTQATLNAPVAYGVAQFFDQLDDGTNNNRFFSFRNPASGVVALGWTVATIGNTLGTRIAASGVSNKFAGAGAAADQASSLNGQAVETAAFAGSPGPAINRVLIGYGNFCNCYLERIALWPTTRLPNATLQSLTQ